MSEDRKKSIRRDFIFILTVPCQTYIHYVFIHFIINLTDQKIVFLHRILYKVV